MTPKRLDPHLVREKLTGIRDLLTDLDEVGDVSAAEMIEHRPTRHIVERVLTQLTELASNINVHIAATRGQAPRDYRESFRAIADFGVISAELAQELAPSVSMRNVLIHEYLDIDHDIVAAAIPRARAAYGQYVTEVARYMRAANG